VGSEQISPPSLAQILHTKDSERRILCREFNREGLRM